MHYDKLETRSPEARERTQFDALGKLLDLAVNEAAGWAERLDGISPSSVSDRAALAKLPVTRKSALVELQRERPPIA